MILINNFNIVENGEFLEIEIIDDNVSSTFTSLLLWNQDTFKDYTQAIDLSYKLESLSNTENIRISAQELELVTFDGVWFIETRSTSEDTEGPYLYPTLGITYNLHIYYQCLLDKLFKRLDKVTGCTNCEDSVDEIVLGLNLKLEMFELAIQEGYYTQAIDLLKQIKKICSINKCSNCKPIECKTCSKTIQHYDRN